MACSPSSSTKITPVPADSMPTVTEQGRNGSGVAVRFPCAATRLDRRADRALGYDGRAYPTGDRRAPGPCPPAPPLGADGSVSAAGAPPPPPPPTPPPPPPPP